MDLVATGHDARHAHSSLIGLGASGGKHKGVEVTGTDVGQQLGCACNAV